MALFHLHVTQVKRSAGQSIVTSAAYRAGEKLYSEYYGEVSDYTHKPSPSESPHSRNVPLMHSFTNGLQRLGGSP